MEISQRTPRRFFISHISWWLLLWFGRLRMQSTLMVTWPIHFSGLGSFPQRFSFRKLEISISKIRDFYVANYRFQFISQIINRFRFRKIQILISPIGDFFSVTHFNLFRKSLTDFYFENYRFLFHSEIINRFLFHKLQISISQVTQIRKKKIEKRSKPLRL